MARTTVHRETPQILDITVMTDEELEDFTGGSLLCEIGGLLHLQGFSS